MRSRRLRWRRSGSSSVGRGAVWLGAPESRALSDGAVAVRDVLARQGASFLADVQAASGLGLFATRDALRELVAAGLVDERHGGGAPGSHSCAGVTGAAEA